MKTTLSVSEARKLALASQGLLRAKPFGSGKAGALAAIRHLGYVQIDTISVVERAHHHTLWSRVPGYRPEMLNDLQVRDRQIFEYWSHAAAYLPMEDYRFCLPRMQAIAAGEKHWYEPDKKLMQNLLDRFKSEGPLMAKDFAAPENHTPGAWWSWKPAKRALEQLFIEGKLMVTRRNNFHKVYDLPERVLPDGIDTTVPSKEEYYRFLIQRAIQANGLATETEIGYHRKGARKGIKSELKRMLAAREVVQVRVHGWDNVTWYTTAEKLNAIPNLRRSRVLRLLSPFDNAIIQRKRVLQLFDFDYQIECYVPAPKRKYGYFCLPILWQGTFVGRLDPKADRATQTLVVKRLVFEPEFTEVGDLAGPLMQRLRKLAHFNGCDRVVLESVEPASWHRYLTSVQK
ncbi:MAG: winged helix-turn-helix domain-containing protein [bacterium]